MWRRWAGSRWCCHRPGWGALQQANTPLLAVDELMRRRGGAVHGPKLITIRLTLWGPKRVSDQTELRWPLPCCKLLC